MSTGTGKKKKIYTDVQLQDAISAVTQGMGISEASQKFNIPKATLHDKVNKKYPEGATPGAHTVLTTDEEKQLVTWILYLSDVGFPITKQILINSVKNLVANLKRPNPFKNGIPGRHWYEGFMARHRELSMRVSQNLTAPRANITEESIRAWFDRVNTYLKKENLEEVLTDPRRIFNCDESAFYLSPKENHVIVKKGSNRVYSRTANDEKECLTVLMTVSADGNMQPPLVLFPYKRTPASIILNMPPKWGIGRSDSGWMTGETFYEYVTNVFYPWLVENKIPLPVILFMDGHSSHINLPLSEFCREHKIILIALLPNSTHRLQPLDVAVFAPLKHHWKGQRQTNDPNIKLKKEDFSKALEQCIKNAALNKAIVNGFKTCGLYPFEPNSIDYSKLIKKVEDTDKNIESDLSTKTMKATGTLLAEVEMRIPENDLEEFRMCGDTWLGDPKKHDLFYFWKKINDECLEAISDHEETLNANNINLLSRIDLDCSADWLGDSEVLNLEVQPDGTLAPDTELPYLAKKACEDTNLEQLALDAEMPRLPEKTCEITNCPETSTICENNIHKPSDIENPELHQNTPLKTIQPMDRPILNEISNLQDTLALNTQSTCLPENSCEVINPAQSPIALTEVNYSIPESLFENNDNLNNIVVSVTHKDTPLKPTQSETRSILTPLKTVTFEDMADLQKKSNSTPTKIQESRNENIPPMSGKNIPTPLKDIRTPFKNALFWPEVTKKDTKQKIKKRVIPTVATSEEFIAYQKRIDNEKKEKERLKEEKKKKAVNLNKEIPIKKRKLTKGANTTTVAEQSKSVTNKRNVGDYVIVNYEGEFFPGIITEIKNNETLVKTMTMSGLNWKWPNKDDIVGYRDEEIVRNINYPNPINKRGVYSVPEIDEIRNSNSQ